MKLVVIASLCLLSSSVNYYHVSAASNGNRNLNVKPTCHKSGKNDNVNGANNNTGKKGNAQHIINGGNIQNGNSQKDKVGGTQRPAGAVGGGMQNNPGSNEKIENMMNNPLNNMFKGNGEGLNIENIMNSDLFQNFFNSLMGSNPNGDQQGASGNMFKDILNSMNNMQGATSSGNDNETKEANQKNQRGGGRGGGGGGEQNIPITPDQLNKINDMKDKLENVLKNVGVDVEQLKENMQKENFLQNKDLFKDVLSNMSMNPSMLNNMMGGNNGNMFNMDPSQMMDMFNKLNQGKMNMNDFGIGHNMNGSNNNPLSPHGHNNDDMSDSKNKAFVMNSKNNNMKFADKFNSLNDEEEQDHVTFQLLSMNNDEDGIDDGMNDVVGNSDNTLETTTNSINRNLSDGDSAKDDVDESRSGNMNTTSTNQNGHNKDVKNARINNDVVDQAEEELIASSSGSKEGANKMAGNNLKIDDNNNAFLDMNNLKQNSSSNHDQTNIGNAQGVKNENNITKKSKGGKKKKGLKKKKPGQIPFKIDALKQLVKDFSNTPNKKIMEEVIKKYVSLNHKSSSGADDEDEDDADFENEKNSKGKETELNMNEFSVKDIKKLISEGILTYEDLTEEELKKLAKPDDVFYELSPYSSDEKDLSLNETSGVSNEQLNAFLRKNGSYHMSYDSKAIDYLKQKKAEKKEEDQEDDNMYDAYKQIKNSYEGIPSNYYHDAPQLIGNNYVFTSIYDKKKELIDFLKRSNGVSDSNNESGNNGNSKDKDANTAQGGTYKSKFYDKYMKKLSEYRRREAFKILKKRRAKELKLKKKQEMQSNNSTDIDHSQFLKQNGFLNSNNGFIKTFSKEQLDNMVKQFNNNGDDLINTSDIGSFSAQDNTFGENIANGGVNSSAFNSNTPGYVSFDGKNIIGSNEKEDEESNEETLNEDEDDEEDDI
ncbi:translocon component PTEX150 [Plasmodium gonderi]|uniref:Translocon component PTEX150 n=1 Tax=Plasmodium gonderi TaxID=77519 RepID=A0A1Y1JQW8_PLAGO|nr:translocon component PTEX150 [Plasmodium gonderi]GAW82873.1 translocon component PTEX150 [Plasmodium gonderi]